MFRKGDRVQFRKFGKGYGGVTEKEMRNYSFSRSIFTVYGGLKGTISKVDNERVIISLDGGGTSYLMTCNAPYILKKNIVPDEYFVL